MSETPLVSVIIPTYNSAHFLAEALDSCLKQTYSPLEIIVVDDGSTDNTHELMSNYPQVQYIRQANAGPSRARNRGLQQSTGNFIQFLDADDIILEHKIERCVEEFSRRPDLGVV